MTGTEALTGVSLEDMVRQLVDRYGIAALALHVPLARCLQDEPTIEEALEVLRRTHAQRKQVERFYLWHVREQTPRARRDHAGDLRAAAAIVIEASKGITDVVEGVHGAIGAFPIITDLVYGAVRGVMGVVGVGIDAAVATLAPLLGDSAPGPQREAVLAALNGVVGDRLEAASNPLAIPLSLQPPLRELHDGGVLLLLVHGSCMNDAQWTRAGHDHGRALARDLGFTPAYAHYNSGRHVSRNGAELATLLEHECAPFRDVVMVAHSMGGLVARAAVHTSEAHGHAWRGKLRALVTLGTPHHGAPLERGGNLFDVLLGVTPWTAPLQMLGRIRSAGVTDLRHGNVVDADWHARERFGPGADPRTPTPLPTDVPCFAIAGSKSPLGTPADALAGDNLVPVPSALGGHASEERTLRFTESRIVYGTNHLDLLASAEVYQLLRGWLAHASTGLAELI